MSFRLNIRYSPESLKMGAGAAAGIFDRASPLKDYCANGSVQTSQLREAKLRNGPAFDALPMSAFGANLNRMADVSTAVMRAAAG
jgi:hypothetical protein